MVVVVMVVALVPGGPLMQWPASTCWHQEHCQGSWAGASLGNELKHSLGVVVVMEMEGPTWPP